MRWDMKITHIRSRDKCWQMQEQAPSRAQRAAQVTHIFLIERKSGILAGVLCAKRSSLLFLSTSDPSIPVRPAPTQLSPSRRSRRHLARYLARKKIYYTRPLTTSSRYVPAATSGICSTNVAPILLSLDVSSMFRGKSSPSALGIATTSSAASGEDADDIEERRRLLWKFMLRIARG